MYWNFVFGSSVNGIIQLLWKGSKEYAKFMETEFIFFTGVKINKVVELYSIISCKVWKILICDVALISMVDKPKQIDEVEIIKFG